MRIHLLFFLFISAFVVNNVGSATEPKNLEKIQSKKSSEQEKKQTTPIYNPTDALLKGETTGTKFHDSPTDQIIHHRISLVEGLVKVLNKKDLDRSGKGPVLQAVNMLGYIRTPKAVKPLAKMLSYRPKNFDPYPDKQGPDPVMYYFPAAVSLGDIGLPSVGPMMDIIISNKSSQLERKLAAWVLLRVECNQSRSAHEEQEEVKVDALLRLNDWRKRYKGQRRKNLQEAIDFVKSYKETYGPPEEVPGFLKPIEKKKK